VAALATGVALAADVGAALGGGVGGAAAAGVGSGLLLGATGAVAPPQADVTIFPTLN